MSLNERELIDLRKDRLPHWFAQDVPDREKIDGMKNLLHPAGVHTVCQSAHCPNMGKCWQKGTATFMILGDICTRGCRFCAVKTGIPLKADENEPRAIALAVKELHLKYVVITSVTRDDLRDQGSGHFLETMRAVRKVNAQVKMEVLIPDFSCREESLRNIVSGGPDVVGHNLETVKRLSNRIRPQAKYERSVDVLRRLKEIDASVLTKSSLMVGLGETPEEILTVMKDLLEAGCDILTIGQYLAPTKLKRHIRVEKYYSPQEFESFRELGNQMGFKYVTSGPLVRSSYAAEEGYNHCVQLGDCSRR